MKIRTKPVTVTLAHRGEVVARNGKVIYRTRPYLTERGAFRAAQRWWNAHWSTYHPHLAKPQPEESQP